MRISRKRVERVLDVISTDDKKYELITIDHLGNAKNYWYTYRIIVKTEPSYDGVDFLTGEKVTRTYITGYKTIKTIINNVSLKKAYEKAFELLNEEV